MSASVSRTPLVYVGERRISLLLTPVRKFPIGVSFFTISPVFHNPYQPESSLGLETRHARIHLPESTGRRTPPHQRLPHLSCF